MTPRGQGGGGIGGGGIGGGGLMPAFKYSWNFLLKSE